MIVSGGHGAIRHVKILPYLMRQKGKNWVKSFRDGCLRRDFAVKGVVKPFAIALIPFHHKRRVGLFADENPFTRSFYQFVGHVEDFGFLLMGKYVAVKAHKFHYVLWGNVSNDATLEHLENVGGFVSAFRARRGS